jgi:hypothetical protein
VAQEPDGLFVPVVRDADKLPLAQLAETIITNPLEYKLSYGLETLDPKLLDAVDVSTPEGRRKLAALLKMLARLAMRSKTQYLAAVKDPAQDKSRSR